MTTTRKRTHDDHVRYLQRQYALDVESADAEALRRYDEYPSEIARWNADTEYAEHRGHRDAELCLPMSDDHPAYVACYSTTASYLAACQSADLFADDLLCVTL
jgi:hypothetical protein